jgi:hypothetical protein
VLAVSILALVATACNASIQPATQREASATPASPGPSVGAGESPAPLPGGRLAYGRFSPGGTISHVFTANTHGTDEQALLSSVAEGPRFSPDGRRIAVVVESPQRLIIFGFVHPDGSDFKRFDSPDPTLNLGCVRLVA